MIQRSADKPIRRRLTPIELGAIAHQPDRLEELGIELPKDVAAGHVQYASYGGPAVQQKIRRRSRRGCESIADGSCSCLRCRTGPLPSFYVGARGCFDCQIAQSLNDRRHWDAFESNHAICFEYRRARAGMWYLTRSATIERFTEMFGDVQPVGIGQEAIEELATTGDAIIESEGHFAGEKDHWAARRWHEIEQQLGCKLPPYTDTEMPDPELVKMLLSSYERVMRRARGET